MSRSLLDTNIISNIISNVTQTGAIGKPGSWWAEQADEDLFISSMTVAEIRRGIPEKTPGKNRRELELWFSGPEAHKRCSPGGYFHSTRGRA